jgi:hypothetical protein
MSDRRRRDPCGYRPAAPACACNTVEKPPTAGGASISMVAAVNAQQKRWQPRGGSRAQGQSQEAAAADAGKPPLDSQVPRWSDLLVRPAGDHRLVGKIDFAVEGQFHATLTLERVGTWGAG